MFHITSKNNTFIGALLSVIFLNPAGSRVFLATSSSYAAGFSVHTIWLREYLSRAVPI